jgi:energy-coupling factor transport system permease protein
MKLHPLSRIVIVVCLSTASVLYQNLLVMTVGLSVCILLHLVLPVKSNGRMFRFIIRLIPLIFSIFVIQLVFNRNGLGILSLGIITITRNGLNTAISVTLRLLIILLSGAWLWELTPRQFTQAFRTARLPETLSVMISLSLRFLPMILEKVRKTALQLRTRGLDIRKLSLPGRLRLYRKLIIPVLGWTLKDLKFLAVALDMRGFRNGIRHTNFREQVLTGIDYLIMTVFILLAFLPLVLSQS